VESHRSIQEEEGLVMQDIVLITSLSLPSIHSYLVRSIKDAFHKFFYATKGLNLAPFFEVKSQQEAAAS